LEPASVLFERYGGIGHGTTLSVLDASGKPRFAHALPALFSGVEIVDAP